MATNQFYTTQMTVTERRTQFLTELRDAGAEKQHAVTIVTVSSNESGTFPRIASMGDVFPKTCYPARPIIALERGNPRLVDLVRESNEQIPQSWRDNQALMNLLRGMNWLDERANGDMFAAASLAAVDSAGTPNARLAALVEFMIDRRWAKELEAFSIGPTQTNLALSGIVTGRSDAPWFRTWEELWLFWTATDAGQQLDSGAWDYLGREPLSSSLRVCGGTEAGCIEGWLIRNQTSSGLDWTSERWSAYAQSFYDAFSSVQRIADQLWSQANS